MTGEPHFRGTHQGHADVSAWARGQAWALYGYTMMYRETRRSEYLQQAVNVVRFIKNHLRLPEDGVPYWDFDAPNIPNALRDASAAAVMASAFIDLSQLASVDNFDADGWLRIGFAGSQINMSESYINTGSLYMCMAAFLPMGLPANHPFWTDPDEAWTNLQAWKGIDVGCDKALRGK